MDDICQDHADASIGNCCDYFVHFVYEKIIENKYDVFNTRWPYKKTQKLIISNNSVSGKKHKCNENFLTLLDANLLKIKEALYNFLQHYDSVLKLGQSKSVRDYSDEIKKFRNKFYAREITLLESKCNDTSKRSTFFKEYKHKHLSDEEQTTYMKQIDGEILNKPVINYDIFYEEDVYQEMEQMAERSVNSMPGITYHCNKMINDPIENDTKYLEYINYWLNHKLKNYERTPEYFIQFLNERLDKRFSAFDDYNKFKEKVYNMDNNIYSEMSMLHNLYLNFNKINNEIISEKFTKFWSTHNNCFKSDPKACKLDHSQKLPKIKTLEEHERETFLKESLQSCEYLSSNNLDIFPQSNNNYAEILKDLSADKAKKIFER
ncbi:hypothetical protein PCYB_001940 [Plasmodium cynomolgi strain B]|uniref:PIR Superfamily Protein n=1 Tax=Plasmodium cynomolgi (strain B) TaxID=1120755 RepID=K6UF42_PLACD|nr:hypothetical protein PCYB_001940 [Plasmodium cynomolgi strain B]GAB69446.1 hypothetical protein PCYB_001940 [Plasmodium cynomolgi strain B]